MSKRTKIVTLTTLLILTTGIIIFATEHPRQNKPIKIGVIAPFSGNAASYGEQVKKGIEIAYQEIKKENGSELKLIYEDNRFDPKLGLTAYRKLVDFEKVKYLITFGGNVCPVINPLAQKDKVANFATGCNTLSFEEPFSYNFRFDVSEAEASKFLMDSAARNMNVQSLALLYVNNDWGTIVADTVKDALDGTGINLVAEEKFNDADGDARSQLQKIKSKNPDAIFFLSLVTFTPTLLKQMREIGISSKLLTNISIEGASAAQFGTLAEGIVYSAPKLEQRDTSRNKSFVEAFPDPTSRNFASWGFDSLYLLSDALREGGDQPEKVVEYLHRVKNYPGAFGIISYSNSGELKLDYEIRTIQNGKFVKISE